MDKRILTQGDVEAAAAVVSQHIYAERDQALEEQGHQHTYNIYGVPRGGIPAAYLVAKAVEQWAYVRIVDLPEHANLIIDDIIDSGATRERYTSAHPNAKFYALFPPPNPAWLVFPWEVGEEDASATDIPTRLLQFIGENPGREGLRDTPGRFLRAWTEYTSGYKQNPKEILKVFTDGAEFCSDEIVLVSNLQVWSKCEHHLSDVFGLAHIGYIPDKKIIGLSKFQRLVDVYGRRLQVQERLTNQIANAIQEHLAPVAVGVVLECRHLCMESRGISVRGAVTVTSALRGAFKDMPIARSEFMSLVRGASRGVSI